jgi:hypothetical protein
MTGGSMTLTLNTPTALQERSNIPFNRRYTHELVSNQIRIMRARDIILRNGKIHVLVYFAVVVSKGRVIGR